MRLHRRGSRLDSWGDDSFMMTLGLVRRPVCGEWDDPTEFGAWVDPDMRQYATAGRFAVADYRYWWEST